MPGVASGTLFVSNKKTIKTMSQNSNNNGCLWALLILLLCPWLVIFVPVLFGFIMGIFGISMGLLGTGIGLFAIVPAMLSTVLSNGWISLLLISTLVAIILPIAFLIYAAIRLLRSHDLPRWQTWLMVILIWLLSLIGMVVPAAKAVHESGGIEALEEQLSNQTQVWEYNWSNIGYNDNEDDNNCDNEDENY